MGFSVYRLHGFPSEVFFLCKCSTCQSLQRFDVLEWDTNEPAAQADLPELPAGDEIPYSAPRNA